MKPMLSIFDLDGTLIDTRVDLTDSVNATRALHGLDPVPLDRVIAALGDGARNLMLRTVTCELPAGADIDEILAQYKAEYGKRLVANTLPYPGIKESLTALRAAGWKTALVTNKPAAATDEILPALGLSPLLDCIIGAGSGTPLKPEPDGLWLAMERCGIPRENAADCWMIGDNHTDLLAAKNAGTKACFCRYGFGSIGGIPFDAEVNSAFEIAELLTK